MLEQAKTKYTQFLDSNNESDEQDWKIISNHFDNLTELRVTACNVNKLGVQVRHETVLLAQDEEQKDYIFDVQSFFIPGAALVPVPTKDGSKVDG